MFDFSPNAEYAQLSFLDSSSQRQAAITLASICSGGGILEQGAIAAGITPIWGVELNPKVADLYRTNYPNSRILVGDVCQMDLTDLPSPDILHVSPPCRNFSQASPKSETDLDCLIAEAVARSIEAHKPKIFTLENVRAYPKSRSWKLIESNLQNLGYSVSTQMIDLKDWGVPQKKRIRFIVVANIGPAINLKSPDLKPTCWHQAIADLTPSLKESELTNVQKDKLTLPARTAIAQGIPVLLKRNQIREYTPSAIANQTECWTVTAKLCTDQRGNARRLFADLVTSEGTYSLSSRALARIQTIPDTYKLSGDVAIDGLAIGDGVPSLFSKQMYQQILEQAPSLRVQETGNTYKVVNRGLPPKTLDELEEVISTLKAEDKVINYDEIGQAFIEIRDKELYKEKGYNSFNKYCKEGLMITKMRVYQFINSAKIKENLGNLADGVELKERHLRPLAKLSPEQQREAFAEALEHPKLTCKVVKAIAQRIKNRITDKPQLNKVYRLHGEYKHQNLDGSWQKLNDIWGVVIELSEFSYKFQIPGQVLDILYAENALTEMYGDWDYMGALEICAMLGLLQECKRQEAKVLFDLWSKNVPLLDDVSMKIAKILIQSEKVVAKSSE